MNARDAVSKSLKSYSEVFPQLLQQDVRLEEVELTDDEDTWSTTISVRNPEFAEGDSVSEPAANSLAAMFNPGPKKRIYKTIRLRSTDGTLLGILDAK